MSPLVVDTLTELAASLADLKDRVRLALATELARVVADAVRDVVQTVFRREPDGAIRSGGSEAAAPSWRTASDPWADESAGWETTGHTGAYSPDFVRPSSERPDVNPTAAVALTAGVEVARWWARRTGRLAAAA